jgi:hypothetical protein
MPNYNTQNPPYAVYPGDVVYPFNQESPAAGQASQQYAVAGAYDGAAGGPSVVRFDISYATAPTAVSVEIQSAVNDADTDYFTEYTSTNTAGESVKLSNFRGRFVRAKLASQTGGGAITVTLER